MMDLPDRITTVEQLDEVLSRPSDALIDFMGSLEGDIMVLGAGGKMGPTLTIMAKRAVDAAGVKKEIIAVGRRPMPQLEAAGIKTVLCDMLVPEEVKNLPKVENIIYMAGRKFGSTGKEWLTWAANVIVPNNIASTFLDSRIVVFSTGCVYPLVDVTTSGSVESDPLDPVGEYSISCLGRERVFDYYCREKNERIVHIRLYYAVELRYGVLVDVATKVFNSQPVDVTCGYLNCIWQGDACDQILRTIPHAKSPAEVFIVTGPEIIEVRQLAEKFAELFGKEAIIYGEQSSIAYLGNATKANSTFGKPATPLEKIIQWTADWIKTGGDNLGKPTHFEVQNGKY